ncbi:hypothetical protein [Devosia naphthalenivorans]|uniref:hypothetical protein n=1 Tax=Devosia naphthalenivorans TaxID=2082392 RepID=UPI000D3A7B8E|nr:hypothetical protein [Devosia naphthalenivorans]
MTSYKFTLHSGQAFTGEDKRDLRQLSEDLCSAGFVVVQRTASGYSTVPKPIALLERAVASVEPAD